MLPRPLAIAPGPVPAGARRRRFGHGIVAGRTEGAAALETRERHPAAGPEAMAADRLLAIAGAGRQIAAVLADEGRQDQLVEPDQPDAEPAGQSREARPDGCRRANALAAAGRAMTDSAGTDSVRPPGPRPAPSR